LSQVAEVAKTPRMYFTPAEYSEILSPKRVVQKNLFRALVMRHAAVHETIRTKLVSKIAIVHTQPTVRLVSALVTVRSLSSDITFYLLSLFVTKVRGLLVEPCVRDMLVPAIFRPIPNALIVVTAGLEALRSSTRVPVHLGVSESVETLCSGCRDWRRRGKGGLHWCPRYARKLKDIWQDWSLQWSKALSRYWL
ncbi:hypothetical protein KCU86_g33, partial [Aureobasidium melanogenum]